jgi:selT/selW/selH-like putative selenoprotein
LLALILFGDAIFASIGRPIPEVVKKMQESKFMYGIGIWIIGNNVQASFLTSGAFEISIDEVVIFSKLETGHMPTSQNLIQIFSAYGLDVN